MGETDVDDSYDSTRVATETLLERIESRPEQSNWLDDRLARVVVCDWTDALTGLQAHETVTRADAQSLRQLRSLYETCAPALRRQATALGVGTINNFSPEETLFMVLVRDLQADAAGKANLNPHKFRVLLDKRYSVESD